jgi:hypothetical protein
MAYVSRAPLTAPPPPLGGPAVVRERSTKGKTRTRSCSCSRCASTPLPADGGSPSTSTERPPPTWPDARDGPRLLVDARRRRLDHVMAWKLDRPFHSTLHCLRTTLEELEHRSVGFSCLTPEIDTTSPTGRLLLTILAAMAEFRARPDV